MSWKLLSFMLKFFNFLKASLFPFKHIDKSYIDSLPNPWPHLSAASPMHMPSAALL